MSNDNKPNTGALFKNKDKTQGSSKPDFSGPWVDERGDEAQIACWLRTSKAGNPYMYVQVTPKYEANHQVASAEPMREPVAAHVEDTFFGDEGWSPE